MAFIVEEKPIGPTPLKVSLAPIGPSDVAILVNGRHMARFDAETESLVLYYGGDYSMFGLRLNQHGTVVVHDGRTHKDLNP